MDAFGVDVVNSMDRHTLGLSNPTQTIGPAGVAIALGVDWAWQVCRDNKINPENARAFVQELIDRALKDSAERPGHLIDRMRSRARGL
jgi:hypothetical protein